MEYIFGGRNCGKTTKALEWLKEAEHTNQYPFWDRVLLVHDLHYAQRLRVDLRNQAKERGESHYADYYNLVYSFQEWEAAHLGRTPVKVMVDDAERLIGRMLNIGIGQGVLVGWTWNINPDDKVTVLSENKSHLDKLDGGQL